MDPFSLVALSAAVGAALNSAATQAGKQTVEGLVGLVRRMRRPGQSDLIEQVESRPETVDAEVLATVLHEEAQQYPEFATYLQQWVREQTHFSGNVTFNITGSVDGNVTQINNPSGPITFN